VVAQNGPASLHDPSVTKLQMHNRVELTRYAIERGLDVD
jgi:hypothetical protein